MRAAAIAVALVAMTAPAFADEVGKGTTMRTESGSVLTGLDLRFGTLRMEGAKRFMFSDALTLGVALPHRFTLSTELTMAFEWDDSKEAQKTHEDDMGWGIGTGLALRKTLGSAFIFYADAEAGVQATALLDPRLGNQIVPDAFVGLRVGYDMGPLTSSQYPFGRSRVFESAFAARLVETPQGRSYMFSVGMAWGGRTTSPSRRAHRSSSSD